MPPTRESNVFHFRHRRINFFERCLIRLIGVKWTNAVLKKFNRCIFFNNCGVLH